MHQTIVVTGNCQAVGIAAALAGFLPGYKVLPIAFGSAAPEKKFTRTIRFLENSRYWLSSLREDQNNRILSEIKNETLERMYLPIIRFPALLPDCVYALRGKPATETLLGAYNQPYNSAIALYSYRKGFSVESAAKLFVPEVFAALGYNDVWNASFDALKTEVQKASIDVPKFMLPLMRQPNFMHTIDHPKIFALAHLARGFAVKMTGEDNLASASSLCNTVRDRLSLNIVWPIYHGIAESYGFRGSFFWQMPENSFAANPLEFLSLSYESYDQQEFDKFQCRALRNPVYSEVLGTAAGVA